MCPDRITSQSDMVLAPVAGSIVCLPATTAIAVVDMTGLPGNVSIQTTGPDQSGASGKDVNPLGRFITVEADGADIYCAFAPSLAVANSLSVTTGASISSNLLVATSVVFGMWKVSSGDKQSWYLPAGQQSQMTPPGSFSQVRWLGFATLAGAGTFRLYSSSQ
jgi:hypothetical protein